MRFQEKKIKDTSIHIGDGNYSSKYPKASDFLTNGVPFFSASDFNNGRLSKEQVRHISPEQHATLKKGHIRENDVLIVTRGNGIGKVAIVEKEYEGSNINAQLALLRTDEIELHSIFLYYLLSSSEYFELLKSYGSGSAQPQLTITSLQGVPLKFPDYSEQVQIAKVLNSIDTKIFNNLNKNIILENIAQTIFKSWFVDFEPVYAKKLALDAGLSIEQCERAAMAIISGICAPSAFAENFKEMDKKLSEKLSKIPQDKVRELETTASLFPSDFEDTELGEIPIGWKAGEVKDISLVKAGYAFKSKDFQDTGLPVVKIKNIDDSGRVSLNDVQYIPKSIAEKAGRFKLKTGDFLIAMTGAKVGKCGLLTIQGKPAYLNQRVGKFEPHSPKHIGYLYTLFMRNESQNYVLATAQGSAQPNISSDAIESMKAVIPPDDLMDLFSSFSFHLINKINISELENLRLSELRDTLLPKLLAGDIDLSKVDIGDLQ